MYTYYSGWMSCLISFVWALQSYEERAGATNSKWKNMSLVRLEAKQNGFRSLIQRRRPLSYSIHLFKWAYNFYNIIACD